jgi:hypothetical protein
MTLFVRYVLENFAKNTDIIKHLWIHSGEWRFSCQVCNKQFNNHLILTTHISGRTVQNNFLRTQVFREIFTHCGNLNGSRRIHHERWHFRIMCAKKLPPRPTVVFYTHSKELQFYSYVQVYIFAVTVALSLNWRLRLSNHVITKLEWFFVIYLGFH